MWVYLNMAKLNGSNKEKKPHALLIPKRFEH